VSWKNTDGRGPNFLFSAATIFFGLLVRVGLRTDKSGPRPAFAVELKAEEEAEVERLPTESEDEAGPVALVSMLPVTEPCKGDPCCNLKKEESDAECPSRRLPFLEGDCGLTFSWPPFVPAGA